MLLFFNGAAVATSIVIQVDPSRILIAADTRGEKLAPGSKSTSETECKIVSLGNAAFAAVGNRGYIRRQLNDPVASWDSRSDAREAYKEQNGDLVVTVDNWAMRAQRHYSLFYSSDPERVKQLAKDNNQNLLLGGFFAGFVGIQATLLTESVYLDDRLPQPIPTTLLNEVSREGAFSCARDRHGDDAVACLPRTVGPHPHGRL